MRNRLVFCYSPFYVHVDSYKIWLYIRQAMLYSAVLSSEPEAKGQKSSIDSCIL